VAHGVGGALVADAAEELGDFILQGVLQNQPRPQPADPLDRICLAVDAG
jgi:hypothetical protein